MSEKRYKLAPGKYYQLENGRVFQANEKGQPRFVAFENIPRDVDIIPYVLSATEAQENKEKRERRKARRAVLNSYLDINNPRSTTTYYTHKPSGERSKLKFRGDPENEIPATRVFTKRDVSALLTANGLPKSVINDVILDMDLAALADVKGEAFNIPAEHLTDPDQRELARQAYAGYYGLSAPARRSRSVQAQTVEHLRANAFASVARAKSQLQSGLISQAEYDKILKRATKLTESPNEALEKKLAQRRKQSQKAKARREEEKMLIKLAKESIRQNQ